MIKKILAVTALLAMASGVQAQAPGFTKLPSGLGYKIARNASGGKSPVVGDYIEVHIRTSVNDSVLFDSRIMNDNKPVPFNLEKPAFKGDLPEGLMMMTPGDSAIFRMAVDDLPMAGQQPAWAKPGTHQMLYYNVVLVAVKSQDEMKTEQDAAAARQKGIDDKLIQDYLAKNNIKATKTASGLYYAISRKGTGETAKAGQDVTVNYTGKTLDGKKFDSNVDAEFNHVSPFSFKLGAGQVIKGWDEGISLLNKGAKGVLYIPSYLAYGANGQGPIKGNSILIFEVELVDAK